MDRELAAKLENLSRVFTPHKPIDLPDLLSGRLPLLYEAEDAINTDGLHLILYGDRGTGKTSLARVMGHVVQQADRVDGRRVLMASCDSSDNYTAIWRRVFQEVLTPDRQLGFYMDQREMATHRLADFDSSDPNDVRLMVQSLPNPTVIIIDEFDRVPQATDARRLMADTIKLFSDRGVHSTIVLVGVADSTGELIAEHESIARNITEIQVEPMALDELAGIVRKGYGKVGLDFEVGVPAEIAHMSQGYPHYTHLLGLWSGRQAVQDSRTRVTDADLAAAIPEALRKATGNVRQEYAQAVASSQPGALFDEVLLACALAQKDSLGKFSTTDLRTPLKLIMGRDVPIGAYQQHLAKFCEPERGPILKKSGKKRTYRWRFTDPQVIPYIIIRARQDGLLKPSATEPQQLSLLSPTAPQD